MQPSQGLVPWIRLKQKLSVQLVNCVTSCDEVCEYCQVEEERKIVSQSVQASEKQNGPRKDHCSVRRGDELHIHSSPGTPASLLQFH